jgi:hypothetical protein
MARITTGADEKVFRIQEFLGLNENPDGDTKLKMGEASVIRNFKVTRDRNLQRRPGQQMVKGLLQAYTLQVEDNTQEVRVDEHVSGKLRMHPTCTVTIDGFLEVSGNEVSVSYENAEQYAGYYWRYDENFTYQLVSCTYDAERDEYTWKMKRCRAVSSSVNQKVAGLWAGNVKGKEYLVGAADGKLWKLHDGAWKREAIGDLDTTEPVFFFGYSEKLYIMAKGQYKEWDGETLQDVDGYRPIVTITVVPSGGGTTYEQVNKLNGKRRCWFSPDGTATTFTLPEKDLKSVDWVKNKAAENEPEIEKSKYTVDLEKGTVTFSTAPEKGINTIEIAWEVKKNFRDKALAMKYAETFNGANDNRVFLYGDGTNEAYYSGLDNDGKPRADYFPDMNVLKVGDANTPITALIRHYSRLIVYKSTSTYSVQYGVTTMVDNTTAATFYATPVNRAIGNVAPGQAQLVLNSPRTLFGHDLYEWKNSSSYSANMTIDERQARRISDRIMGTLAGFDLEHCRCWDDNDNQEYYIINTDNRALVHNYAADAWYCYTAFDVTCFVNFRGKLYSGDSKGRLNLIAYTNRTDNGEKIESYWESGAESFSQDFMRKYSAMLWVGIKPETHGEVYVTVQTDRKSAYTNKVVVSSLISFSGADFRKWSFNPNRKPHMKRLKIKAKKFVFYKLIFRTESINTTVTILSADMRVRFTGYAR